MPPVLDPSPNPKRALAAAGVALLATGLFFGWLGLDVGGGTSVRYVDDLGTVFAALTAAVLCARAGRKQAGSLRRFWWLLGAACGAWTLGEALWAVYELALHASVPFPSWADLGYLGAIPFAVAALLSHPAMRVGGTTLARTVLDGMVLATSLLFLSWALVLGPLWRSTDLSTLAGVVALAYPFADVVVVFLVVLIVRGMTGSHRLSLWCLLGGLLAMAISDSTYAYLTEVQGYATGNLLDAGWVAAYLAIALGAYAADAGATTVQRMRSSSPTLASLTTPFLPVLGALTLAAIEVESGHDLDNVALWTAFALAGLVLARQALLAVDVFARRRDHELTMSRRLAHHPSRDVIGGRHEI
jgi:hypothetical protein